MVAGPTGMQQHWKWSTTGQHCTSNKPYAVCCRIADEIKNQLLILKCKGLNGRHKTTGNKPLGVTLSSYVILN